MISPLEKTYQSQIHSLAATLNHLNGADTIHCFDFDNIAEFADQIEKLMTITQPWESDGA